MKMNRKTIAAIIALATPLVMGASCGSDRAIWNNPAQPLEDIAPVIDAHKQAAKDVSDWGAEFAKGWNGEGEKPKPIKNCKPWKIICQGQN